VPAEENGQLKRQRKILKKNKKPKEKRLKNRAAAFKKPGKQQRRQEAKTRCNHAQSMRSTSNTRAPLGRSTLSLDPALQNH